MIPLLRHLPAAPAPHFVGRGAELERLRAWLTTEGGDGPSVCVITGLAGSGKTQLALRFSRAQAAGRTVLWVRCGRGGPDVTLAVAGLDRLLGLPSAPSDPPALRAGRVREALEEGPPCLLVFDDACPVGACLPHVPRRGRVHVLITARSWDGCGDGHITLGPLPRDEAVRWLEGAHEGLAGDPALAGLCGSFDDLPVALALLWRRLHGGVFSPEELCREIEQEGPLGWIDQALRCDPGVEHRGLSDGLAAGFSMIEDRWARALGEIGGVTAPAPVPDGLLRDAGARLLGEPVGAAEVRDALRLLRAAGIARPGAQGTVFHSLWRAFADRMSGAPRAQVAVAEALAGLPAARPEEDLDDAAALGLSSVRPHLEQAAGMRDQAGAIFFSRPRVRLALLRHLNAAGHYREAAALGGGYAAEAQDDVRRSCLFQQGWALYQLARYPQAACCFDGALAAPEAPPGWIGAAVALARALLRLAAGEHRAAAAGCDEAIRLCRQAGLPIGAARGQVVRGAVLVALGRYREALLAVEKGPEGLDAHVAAEHPARVEWLCVLGEVLYHLGRYADAVSRLRQARDVAMEVLPAPHPLHAALSNQLGRARSAQGAYGEALDLHREAAVLLGAALPREHPLQAVTQNLIGLSYRQQSEAPGEDRRQGAPGCDPAELALRHHQAALRLSCHALGDEHPVTAGIRQALGQAFWTRGCAGRPAPAILFAGRRRGSAGARPAPDFAAAERLLREAYAQLCRGLGRSHPELVPCSRTLGLLCCAQDQLEMAETYLLRAQALSEQHLGEDHPETASCYHALADLLESRGDRSGAVRMLQRTLALRRAALGAEHPLSRLSAERLREVEGGSGGTTEGAGG